MPSSRLLAVSRATEMLKLQLHLKLNNVRLSYRMKQHTKRCVAHRKKHPTSRPLKVRYVTGRIQGRVACLRGKIKAIKQRAYQQRQQKERVSRMEALQQQARELIADAQTMPVADINGKMREIELAMVKIEMM